MRPNFSSYILSFVFILLLFSACKKEDSNTYGNDEISIADHVLILNEDQSGRLVEVDNTELTFSGGNSEIESIAEGDIIVSDIIEGLAPRGFLRRVLSITKNGNQIILTTETAQLTDAIERCSVRFEKAFTDEDIGGKTSSFDFELNLSDNSPLSGELSLAPRLLFDLDIDLFRVEYAKLGIGINHSMSVSLATLAGIRYELEKELFEKDLRPITILIGGIFPLIITPDFELTAGFAYEGPTFYTNYSVAGSTEYYVEKNDNGWDAHKDSNENAVSSGISGSIETGFEFYIQPELEFEFYDIDNVETSFYVKKYIKGNMEYDSNTGISCELKCGIGVGAEVEVKILGFELNPNIEAELFDFDPFYECPENGLSGGINDLIPDSIINILDGLDMPINEGFNPPNIEGTFYVSPLILKSTNISDDNIGHQFSDLTLQFSNINRQDLTVTVYSAQGNSEGTAVGSFIVGNGNGFSVFVEINLDHPIDGKTKLATVYSGEVSSSGISNFHCAHLMLNDYGDPNNAWIEIGQARVVYDSDGFSPKQ